MPEALTEIKLANVPILKRGKVREVFDLGDQLLICSTDRISAYDVVLKQGIPQKGEILNRLSCFWFNYTKSIVANHFLTATAEDYPEILKPYISNIENRSMLVKKVKIIPIECVVRGYLAGSAWQDYKSTGMIADKKYTGLIVSQKLPEPIFTPATKASSGHDQNITVAEAGQLVGEKVIEFLERVSIKIYEAACKYAWERGIIIADTKFEFGFDNDQIILSDEVFTPDSSRFWAKEDYREGISPPSFDKQFVRDYLTSLNWNRQPPPPDLPPEIIEKTREKYLEAQRRLIG